MADYNNDSAGTIPVNPYPELRKLDRLTGRWEITGSFIQGKLNYEWLEGGFFFIHNFDLTQNASGKKIKGVEYIGFDEVTKTLRSRMMDNHGHNFVYTWEISDDILKIWFGDKGSDNFFEGKFSDDDGIINGRWQWPEGNGKTGGYESVITRINVDNKFKSNTALDKLDVLAGDWLMEASMEGTVLALAKANFSWIENRAFLIQHSEAEPPLSTTPQIWIDNNPNPLAVIIGYDNDSAKFYYVYADARGVRRVYQMSFENEIWKIWGKAGPDFHQRFEGRFNSDNTIISGFWEHSADGKKWDLDFEVLFRKE